MSENEYSSKPKYILLECSIFSQEKVKFRGRNAITNRKLIISWSWNTSRDSIKSHKSLYFTQIIGPMAV